MTTIQAHTEI